MTVEQATLGGGCFWCLEAVFAQVKGVYRVRPGYAGGHLEAPTYERVCGGTTGHAEVVQIEFEPSTIGFRDLLDIFFGTHDPTTVDRQGSDVGPQYRSVIFVHSAAQQAMAVSVIDRLSAEGVFEDPIVTRVDPFERFWPAEEDHAEYYQRHPQQPYCATVIAPKVASFRRRFAAHRRVEAEFDGCRT